MKVGQISWLQMYSVHDKRWGNEREVRREREKVTGFKIHVTMTSCIVHNILEEVWKSDPANSIQSTQKYTHIYTHTQKKTRSNLLDPRKLFFLITPVSH